MSKKRVLNNCLFEAIRERKPIEYVKELIAEGANTTGKNSQGITPLHLAIQRRNLDVVKLLGHGKALGIKATKSGRTPLAEAVIMGYTRGVIFLAEQGYLNEFDNNGYTPLHHATLLNQQACLEALVAAGADVELQDDRGRTPLMISIEYPLLKAVKTLVEDGGAMIAGIYRDTDQTVSEVIDAMAPIYEELQAYLHGKLQETIKAEVTPYKILVDVEKARAAGVFIMEC